MTVAYSTIAYSEGEDGLDYSVPSPFALLLQNPYAQLSYLVELYPFDESLEVSFDDVGTYGSFAFGEFDATYPGGVVPVYFSDIGFKTKPSDSLVSKFFHPRIDNPFQFDLSVLSGDEFGASNQSFGSVTIYNGDGKFDFLHNYLWAARRVIVKAGTKDFSYDQFETIFDGSSFSFEADEEKIIITIQDNRAKTDQLIIVPSYAGTGGLAGGTDLANKSKPLAYGVLKNIEPVLLDAAALVFQVHDGAVQSIDAVRDKGIALTFGGDVADITVASVSAGQYKTQLSGGYFKLGSTPAGTVTADVHGENGNGGYVSKTADIMKRVAKTRLGSNALFESDFDVNSFDDLNSNFAADVGLYLIERATVSNIFDAMMSDIAGYWTFTRQGKVFFGLIDNPENPTITITEFSIDEGGITLASKISPAWRLSVGYAPVYIVQDLNDFAAGVSASDKAFYSEQYRNTSYEDGTLKNISKRAVEKVFQTRVTDLSNANALLDRLKRVYSVERKTLRLTIYRSLYQIYVGDVVRLVYNRYGLEDGQNFIVVGVSEDAESGQSTFELWG